VLVTNKNVQDVLQGYTRSTRVDTEKTRGGGGGAPTGAPSKRDAVELSSWVMEVQKAVSALRSSPDVRQDLVNGLKRDIAQGTFKVNLDEVASQLLLVV
jgi:flagellar biosynthesis anti-sigma factor FlgM